MSREGDSSFFKRIVIIMPMEQRCEPHQMLNDATIRVALKNYLNSKAQKPKLLVEELRIHNGNSIADLVAVYGFLHGFEIKGESDSVSRIRKQAEYYERSFPMLTLVTTANHIRWALTNVPHYWGIIEASESSSGIKFNYLRAASNNPFFSRETSLLMLWKDELIRAAKEIEQLTLVTSDSRATIAKKISTKLPKAATAKMLSTAIYERFHKLLQV